ncbi:MAG: sugar transferase [bacterium]|nr:sugar transferase [bacterium]
MYRFLKRTLDIVAASVALLLFLPFGLVICVLLRFSGEGEIFYRQKRVGHDRRTFGLYKFATMLKDSPSSGTITMQNDPRVLPMGHFLRKTKLNEVPQLLNILFGDISIVGWRPLTETVFGYYPDEVQQKISRVKPGMTGIGSIVFRDEESLLAGIEREDVPRAYQARITPYKGALECWYADHASIWLDVKLIVLTAWAVLLPGSTLHERALSGLPERPAEPPQS